MSQWIQTRFIPVKINISEKALPLDLHVNMTPSFFFISKNKEFIKKIPGSWNQEDFKSLLKEVIHE
jgi:thioredoxin-related protein